MIENIKLPEFQPKGLIKVELFEDDKVVEEINTHNFISKGVLDTIFKAKMRDVFTDKRVTGGTLISDWFEDAFSQISLTTANHPESPETEWLRAGELIGYAYSDITYSGSSPLQGGYNSTESFTRPEHVRMVFDFPTNVANGTFESVYFHPKTGAYKNKNIQEQNLVGLRSIQKHDDKYYLLKSNKLEIYDANWGMLGTHTTTSDTWDFCIVANTIYYVRNLLSGTIVKADISNPSEVTNVKNISTQCGGIIFDDTKQQFIVADYVSPNTVLIYFDNNFNELSRDILVGIMQQYTSSVISSDDEYLLTGAYAIDKNKNGNQIARSTVRGIIDNSVYFTSYEYPKTFIGSRSLLDTPITKTDKQTMKITYDFILPPMY